MGRLRLETVSTTNAMIFKVVRLRALREDPTAFGSTYAEESRLTDAEWIDLAARRSAHGSMVWLAFADDDPCGIVGVFLEDATRARLVSMWVAREARRQGIGKALVDAVIAWARESRAQTVVLTVTRSPPIKAPPFRSCSSKVSQEPMNSRFAVTTACSSDVAPGDSAAT